MNQVNDSIGTFRNIATAISAKYLAQVQLMTAEHNARPPFDELMTLLKQMEKDLTGHGVKVMENLKGNAAYTPAHTDELKSIIRSTIEDFIRKL